MKLPRISVIIPALNEAASIGLVIEDIPAGCASEIMGVDNGQPMALQKLPGRQAPA